MAETKRSTETRVIEALHIAVWLLGITGAGWMFVALMAR